MGTWTKIDVPDDEFREAKGAMGGLEFGTHEFVTQPVVLERLSTEHVLSKFREKKGNVEIQIFYPDQSLDRPWNTTFAYALYEVIIREFNLEHYRDRVLVEFVPEVNGWYVVIRNVAYLKSPDPGRLSNMINRVLL